MQKRPRLLFFAVFENLMTINSTGLDYSIPETGVKCSIHDSVLNQEIETKVVISFEILGQTDIVDLPG